MAVTLADIVAMIRGDNTDLKSKLSESEKASQSAGANMAKFLGGAVVAGAALAGTAIIGIGSKAFDVASQIDAATDQIGASLGLTDDQARAFGETIKRVYGNNFGDSIGGVGAAVENVAKQLSLTANDPALAKMTENAFRLRDVFGTEVNESIDAVKTLMENFGLTGEEAFDLIATGYQRGLDRSGDFLDTIGEYSVQFSNGGATAYEFFKIIEEGAQGGMLGTDKAADAFKEFNIRIMDGSKTTNNALNSIGLVYEHISDGFADGSLTAVDAMRDVLDAIFAIEDPISRNMAGVALFGTQWEDLGEDAMRAIAEINEGFGTQEGAIDTLNTKYTSLGSVAEGMWRKFEIGLAPAGEAILGFVNDNLPQIEGVINTVSGRVADFVGQIPIAMAAVQKAWDEDWAGMKTTVTEFVTAVPIALQGMWTEIDLMFQREGDKTGDGWENFWQGLSTFFSGWVLVVINSWTEALRSIRSVLNAIGSLFRGDWDGFWDGMYNYMDSIANQMLNFIEFWFGPNIRNALAGALNDMWDGAREKMAQIQEWWRNAWTPFRNMLPFSEPKDPRSPLRGLGDSGEAMIGNFQQGMERGLSGLMNGFTAGLGQFATSGNTNYEIHVNLAGGGYQAGYSAGEGVLDAMRYQGLG